MLYFEAWIEVDATYNYHQQGGYQLILNLLHKSIFLCSHYLDVIYKRSYNRCIKVHIYSEYAMVYMSLLETKTFEEEGGESLIPKARKLLEVVKRL